MYILPYGNLFGNAQAFAQRGKENLSGSMDLSIDNRYVVMYNEDNKD